MNPYDNMCLTVIMDAPLSSVEICTAQNPGILKHSERVLSATKISKSSEPPICPNNIPKYLVGPPVVHFCKGTYYPLCFFTGHANIFTFLVIFLLSQDL